MTANWAYNLDMLAQNGVLDFDAPSFVMGQAPRYVGRPSLPPSPYATGIPPAPALNQPEIDEFKPQKQKAPKREQNDDSIIHNPSWKKWAFGALAIGGLVLLGFKYKAIWNWVRNGWSKLSSNLKWSNVKTFCSNKWNAFTNFCSKCWNKFTGLFKKNP